MPSGKEILEFLIQLYAEQEGLVVEAVIREEGAE